MHVDGPEGFPDSGCAFSDWLLTLGVCLPLPSAKPGLREGKMNSDGA